MKCPEVNSCCCCFSLRSGSAVFGIISLLLSALFAIQSSLELFLTSATSDDKNPGISPWVLGADIILQVIQTVAALILLLGVWQENCTLLKPWLFTTVVVLIAELTFLPTFPSRIIFLVVEYSWDWYRFFINLPFIIDDIYGFLVVYSYSCTLSGSHMV